MLQFLLDPKPPGCTVTHTHDIRCNLPAALLYATISTDGWMCKRMDVDRADSADSNRSQHLSPHDRARVVTVQSPHN
jgi:hypothetical protein